MTLINYGTDVLHAAKGSVYTRHGQATCTICIAFFFLLHIAFTVIKSSIFEKNTLTHTHT